MEELPPLKITFGDTEYEGTPENTILYTFKGQSELGAIAIQNSDVNHVYFKISEKDGDNPAKGHYVFERFYPEAYKTLASFVLQHEFPQLLNMRHVPECDVHAYLRHKEHFEQSDNDFIVQKFVTELPDFLPEDFN